MQIVGGEGLLIQARRQGKNTSFWKTNYTKLINPNWRQFQVFFPALIYK